MIVVNLFGAPGSGKSTGAAYIFAMLKMKGVDAELVTEFAKDKVWEGSPEVFKNQSYVFGKQSFRLSRLKDKVEVVITDSPLPLSIYYNDEGSDSFNTHVMDVFNSYENVNYFISRVKPYNPNGRFQTGPESDMCAFGIKALLDTYSIPYASRCGEQSGYDLIVKDIINKVYKKV